MWNAKFCGYKSFGVYYLWSWFGSFLLFMIGRLFKVLAMLTCMQEVGHSDQWLVSVVFLSTFGFGLEFPVMPPYPNWESFMDAVQELMVLSFTTLCGKWTLGWLLLEISDLFTPCVRALWFTQHPGIEISALNQVTFSLRTFSSSRCNELTCNSEDLCSKLGELGLDESLEASKMYWLSPLVLKGTFHARPC